MVGQLIPDCYVELEKIILSERKNVPIEFPVIGRKRLFQLVRENQLQLDEQELSHAVHFLNESGTCPAFLMLIRIDLVENFHSEVNRTSAELLMGYCFPFGSKLNPMA